MPTWSACQNCAARVSISAASLSADERAASGWIRLAPLRPRAQRARRLLVPKEALGNLMGSRLARRHGDGVGEMRWVVVRDRVMARSRGDSVRDDVSAPPRARGGFSGEGPRTAHRCADPRSGGASRTKSALATRSSRREALRSSHAIERRTRTPAEAPDEGSDEGIERERRSARST